MVKVFIIVVLSLFGFLKVNCAENGLKCGKGKSCDDCGLPEIMPNIKIVGGKTAIPFSWPSQVLILQTYKFKLGYKTHSTRFICGGTLIDRNTILTAAHCFVKAAEITVDNKDLKVDIKPNSFYPSYESMFKVYAGVFNTSGLSSNTSFRIQTPSVEISVKKIIIHENYNFDLNLNDIAIFKLAEPIQPSKFIKPACLPPEQSITYPGTNLDSYASGWGTLKVDGPLATNLHNVKLKIYDEKKCKNYGFIFTDWKSQICAGLYEGGKDTCQGDSGGGLYVLDTIDAKKRYVLVGIVSFGMGCGLRGYPGIYTRTSYYLEWINKNR